MIAYTVLYDRRRSLATSAIDSAHSRTRCLMTLRSLCERFFVESLSLLGNHLLIRSRFFAASVLQPVSPAESGSLVAFTSHLVLVLHELVLLQGFEP